MAVLMASSAPTTTLTTARNTKPILTLRSPAFSNSLYLATTLQRLLSTTTPFLLFRAYLLSLFLHASQILLQRGLYASSTLCKNAYRTSKQGMRALWKSTEGTRRKLFREFMVFILGGGNPLILVVFWPGWIVLGGGAWVLWSVWG